jgi:hypothetical protein
LRLSDKFLLVPTTVCILFTTTLYLASKFLDDTVVSTKFWASISGFEAHHLVNAERQILEALHFDLFVRPEDHAKLCGFGLGRAGSDQLLGVAEEKPIHVTDR